MKNILLFLFTLFSLQAFGQEPTIEMLIFPKYIEGGTLVPNGRNGIPYVYRAKISKLHPGRTYRYTNRLTTTNIGTGGSVRYLYILPGQNVSPNTSEFYRPAPSTANGGIINGSTDLSSGYGSFTADENGTYTGWFIQETVSNLGTGSIAYLQIALNEPGETGTLPESDLIKSSHYLFSPASDPLIVVTMASNTNTGGVAKYGTAIRSTAAIDGINKNFVFLYDNENGTGRPIAGTLIENDGVVGTKNTTTGLNGYSGFYWTYVNGFSGTWGSMILNNDPNGVRRIEQWSSANNGSLVGYNTSADGTWASGRTAGTKETTVNVNLGFNALGTTGIVLDGSVVTLGAVKTDQTVVFTNTFPATYKVGDPDFTLSAISDKDLSRFEYSVEPADGVLKITDGTVKIIGGGTATITVKEPGNTTINAGIATKSITVDAASQTITGLPASLNAIYGDPNLELTATGGASANAIVYTSDGTSIAEITGGNKVILKKSGTVIIRANQAGNTSYLAAPEVITTLTITKASLDVIAEDKVKVQGGVNPAATFIYGAFKGTDDATSVMGTPSLTTTATDTSPTGEYDINIDVSGLTSDKYTFNPVKGKLRVEAKLAQFITVNNFPAAAVYGNEPIPFQATSNTANEITFSSSNTNVAVIEKNAIGEWTLKVIGAGEADITATQAEDVDYIPAKLVQHVSIAKAPLSVIADDKAILVGDPNPAFTARYAGFVNNDEVSKLAGNLTFAKQADGAGFLIIPSGLTSVNYTLTFVNGRLTQGNTAFASINKVYGDSPFDPGARSSGATVTYSVANTAVADMGTTGLLEIKGAGTTQITANFSTGLSSEATLTVAQKEVVVTASGATRVYGQANPVFTASYTGWVNGENETVITTAPQIVTTAVTASPVAKYTINASGAAAANYKFIYKSGVLDITRAALSVKADNQSKIYGQGNPALSLTGNGLVLQDQLSDLNLNTVVATAVTAASPVNTYPITVSGQATVANYTVTYLPGIFTVTPAALVIKPVNAERPQGEPNPVFAFSYDGFMNGDLPAGLTTGPVAVTTATTASGKGVYPITASGASSANYTISYLEGQLSIKGLQTITYANFPVITYGDANFSPVVTSDSGVQPVFTSDNLSVAVIENGRVKIISAGTANITASFAATADYVAATAVKPLVIAKRTLLVRADSKTKLYGQANPVLTATYDGFVNGENITAVTAPALLTTTATPLSVVGTYSITGSAASALNYSFTYEAGVLTVDKAILTVTADNKTRLFGVENPVFTFKYTGFVNAENEAVVQNPALGATDAVLTSPAGKYTITPGGAADENYAFNYVTGVLTVTVTTRTITMDAIAVKTVGDADFVPNVILTSNEVPVFSSSDLSVATIVNNKIHVVASGNVTITASAPVNPSYSSTPFATRLLVVSKVAQTITFEAVPVLEQDGVGYTLKASSTSGLPVTFTVSDPSRISLNGDVIIGLRIGKVQVTASQAGNSQYAAANVVSQDVQVADAAGDGLQVHAALSINGDGVNEFLTIDGIKDFPLNKVTIINRNGLKVFDVEGYDNDTHIFAGKSKSGALLPQGTYFCLIEYNVDSKLKRKTGYFILKY